MTDRALIGLSRHTMFLPAFVWKRAIGAAARKTEASLGFMTQQHHDVRNFVVTELPRTGEPMAPEQIAERLSMAVPDVIAILDELEKRMTFLFRNEGGAVVWAYPVTVDETPHEVRFDSGERLFSA